MCNKQVTVQCNHVVRQVVYVCSNMCNKQVTVQCNHVVRQFVYVCSSMCNKQVTVQCNHVVRQVVYVCSNKAWCFLVWLVNTIRFFFWIVVFLSFLVLVLDSWLCLPPFSKIILLVLLSSCCRESIGHSYRHIRKMDAI